MHIFTDVSNFIHDFISMFPLIESIVQKLIHRSFRTFMLLGSYCVMLFELLYLLVSVPPRWKNIIEQFYELGVRSAPLICLTGLSTGMVLAAQAFFQLSDKGLTGTTGIMVTKSMLVEIGPILTSFMITGRVGAAISAELGSMKVTEQIDAMASMSVNPLEYLVLPRCCAMVIMTPMLAALSSAAGIFGAWFVSVNLYSMTTQAFFDPIPIYVNWFDIFANILKSWIFGILIVSISCFYGMNVTGGARGVGKSTTSSVVTCYISILASNFFLTIGLNACYRLIFGFS